MIKKAKGFTLAEVVIAMLVVMVAAPASRATAMTGRQAAGRTGRRVQAAQAARGVAEALKLYQPADITAAPGPGGPPNGWGLPGDLCGCAALRNGVHNLSAAVWAPDLAAQGGNISYTVTTKATALGPQPTAAFDVTWTEP